MRSIVLLCTLAILLSGCAEWKTKAAADQDAEDDAKCQSSGGKPDDPAYIARSSMRHARKRRRGPTNSRESVQGHQHFRRVRQPIDLTHRRNPPAETAKMLTKDEARRIAANIAKLPVWSRPVTPTLVLRSSVVRVDQELLLIGRDL